VTFTHFTEEEQEEFASYIQEDKMVVTKIISYDLDDNHIDQEYFSYQNQIPQFAKIRMLPRAREKTNALKELINAGILPELSGNPRSEADTLKIIDAYETAHQDLLQPIKTSAHFFGARNIGGGILDKYTKFIFFPAVKEATEETSGRNCARVGGLRELGCWRHASHA
jgi:hypothetical protein